MDNNGQLTFSDDPVLPGINDAFKQLENGDFETAAKIFDELLTKNPDFPGLVEGYRVSRFWQNRRKDLCVLREGKDTADGYMNEWDEFMKYSADKSLSASTAFKSVQKFIFYTAANHYRVAFSKNEDPTNNYGLIIKLGNCLIALGEYYETINILEYARNTYTASSRILSMLAEAYFHVGDVPKSLLLFRESFFIDPSDIDLESLKANPIKEIVSIVREKDPNVYDIREWVPIYGFINDVFYVRRQINSQVVDQIKNEIYTFEKMYQSLPKDKREISNIIPRLINKYLWLYDYYQFQKFNPDILTEIKLRLIEIERKIFDPYFKSLKK